MLAHTPSGDVQVQPGADTKILSWTADGTSLLIGFMATGTYSGTVRLLVNGDPWYTYRTSPSDRTAYVADRAVCLPAGEIVEIHVMSDSQTAESFSATLLGGAS